LVTVATVVSGDWVATVLVTVVVGDVLVDVIFGNGNALEQYVTAGAKSVKIEAATADIPPLQNGLAADTSGISAAREPLEINLVYMTLNGSKMKVVKMCYRIIKPNRWYVSLHRMTCSRAQQVSGAVCGGGSAPRSAPHQP
jgi:hypothetical protein